MSPKIFLSIKLTPLNDSYKSPEEISFWLIHTFEKLNTEILEKGKAN